MTSSTIFLHHHVRSQPSRSQHAAHASQSHTRSPSQSTNNSTCFAALSFDWVVHHNSLWAPAFHVRSQASVSCCPQADCAKTSEPCNPSCHSFQASSPERCRIRIRMRRRSSRGCAQTGIVQLMNERSVDVKLCPMRACKHPTCSRLFLV